MNNINEEINNKFQNVIVNKLGSSSLLVGKSIEDTNSRFKFGLNHSVNEQVQASMNYEQDGYHKLFNNQIEAIHPSFVKIDNSKSKPKKNILNYQRVAEGESLSENKLGYGLIRGFEKPQKIIVNEKVDIAEKMDTDKTGAELSGKGLAGKNEIKFLAEVKKSETKQKNLISNETEQVETEKQSVVNDLKTIVNF